MVQVGESMHVMVLNTTKDEQMFSNLVFMKNKILNCLTTYLDLVVWMYCIPFIRWKLFPST